MHEPFLISELAAENFRLALEGKLVNNLGNSRTESRSQAIPNNRVKG